MSKSRAYCRKCRGRCVCNQPTNIWQHVNCDAVNLSSSDESVLISKSMSGCGWDLKAIGSGEGSGTVTSVGMTVPTGLFVNMSPITSNGTFNITTNLNGLIRGTGTGFTIGNVNLASEVTGILGAVRGGTGLNAVGSPAQILRVNSLGTGLEYFTPTFMSSVSLTGDISGSGTSSVPATINNNAVTFSKIQNISTQRILGRVSSGTGLVEQIQIGSNLVLAGGVLSANTGITQLSGDVLTASGSGLQSATLSNTGVSPGTYSSADITVDAKGRILAATNGSGGGGGGLDSGDF